MRRRLAVVLTLLVLVAGCSTNTPVVSASKFESFDSQETHSRLIDATPAQACEAARRALLSQGYLIAKASTDAISGRKTFQPERELTVELEMRVVCVREGRRGEIATLFVTGTEETYTVKKSSSSASVGVGMLGSLSLPFTASEEALVKVGSQTITQPQFYDRFYMLVYRYLDRSLADETIAPADGAATAAPVDERPR